VTQHSRFPRGFRAVARRRRFALLTGILVAAGAGFALTVLVAAALAATTLSAPRFSLTAGAGSLRINSFSAVSRASGYLAEQCDASGSACATPVTVTTAGYTFSGLAGGTSDTIKLQAVGNGTTYLSSAWTSHTGTPAAAPLGTPTFTLTPGNGALTLNSFAAVPNATSYSAQRCNATGTGCATAITVTTAGTTFSGLTNGTTYTVKLTAIGDGTAYANSAVASHTGVPATITLPAPSFTLTPGPGSLTINGFAAVPNAASYSYQVCNGQGAACGAATAVTTAGTTIAGLVGGTTYKVSLTAVGNGGTYANSAPASQTGTPAAVGLATPALTVTPGPGSLVIGAFAAVPNASSYSYQVCNLAGTSCGPQTTVTTSGATITGLVGGTGDLVTLTAIGNGTSYSNSIPATQSAVPSASVLGTPSLVLTPSAGTLAINAFPAVPGATSYRYQVCDAGGANCAAAVAVTGAGAPITGLADGTSYTVTLTAVGDGVVYADSTPASVLGTPGAVAAGATPLIIDTDMWSDAGDAGAIASAFALQQSGEANVIATVVNTRTDRPAVAIDSWKCVAAIAQFYGANNMLIGSDMPDTSSATSSPNWAGPCGALASPSTPAPDTALNTYRKALVSQPDHSVVIAGIGYFENLSALLNSPADAISPLTGKQLVALKVKSLVVMAGCFPSCSPGENNVIGNVAAAQNVAANWPTKIVWSGFEVGNAVHSGQTVTATHPVNSPVRAAYMSYVGANNWIYAFDQTAIYHAIRPSDPSMSESATGTVNISGTGADSFTAGSGNSTYLILNNATALDASLETLLDVLPPTPLGPLPNDSFDANTLSPSLWNTSSSGSSVTATGQQLQISHPAGAWTNGALIGAAPYDATGHTTQVQLVRAANNGQGATGQTGGETSMFISKDATHYADIFVGGGGLAVYVNSGSGETNITPGWVPYNAAAMQWLRIRESAGTLYFEYAGGATVPGAWTTLAQIADAFPVNRVTLKLAAGSDMNAADTAIFDNLSTN
jgi:hypothetical protein